MAAKEVTQGMLIQGLGEDYLKGLRDTMAKPPTVGFGGDCPAGLEGVARLRSLTFGIYSEETNADMRGKPFFMGQAEILTPEFFSGPSTQNQKIKIKGRFTKFGPEPLFDTPKRKRKTKGMHLDHVINALRVLGWQPKALPNSLQELDAMLRAAAKALEKSAPYFRYRTFEGNKLIGESRNGRYLVHEIRRNSNGNWDENSKAKTREFMTENEAKTKTQGQIGADPMVNHVWLETCSAPEIKSAVTEDTSEDYRPDEPTPSANGTSTAATDAAPKYGVHYNPGDGPGFDEFDDDADYDPDAVTAANTAGSTTTAAETHSTTAGGEGDLDTLLEGANARNATAQEELERRCIAVGYTKEECDGVTEWEGIVDMIRHPRTSAAATATAGAATTTTTTAPRRDPVVNDAVHYFAPTKSGQRGKKSEECRVTAVNKRKRVCQLKSLRDNKTVYEGVSFDMVDVIVGD